MSIDIEKIKAFFETPEHKAWAKNYVKQLRLSNQRQQKRLKAFHQKYGNNLDAVLERLMDKYYSDKYINKEYRLGYQPRNSLLWFVFEYARNYCQPCYDKTYYNEFTGGAYYVGSYVMQVIHGQGSEILIEKQKTPIIHEPITKRFEMDAETVEEAVNYINARAIQFLRLGYKLSNLQTHEWGVDATFRKGKKEYQGIYIIEPYRNKGLYPSLVTKTILTANECDIERYLEDKSIKYVSVELIPFAEYDIIQQYYGGKKAKRSGLFHMNHIDEGLAILEWIGASEQAKKAYCLHPIFQADDALVQNADSNAYEFESPVLIRAMEYRSVANEYLSKREIKDISEIRLSPLKDVNDMLIADKIQNRKDFELYHESTHPRSKELAQYFRNWLERLGVSEKQYQKFKQKLTL